MNPYYEKRKKTEVFGSKLPHWHQDKKCYFVSFRLADSLPADVVRQYNITKAEFLAKHPMPWDEATSREYNDFMPSYIDKYLDSGHGSCLLRDEEVRSIVWNTIFKENNDRYMIDSLVIMPNHIHVLMTLLSTDLLSDIIPQWKSITAHMIKRILPGTRKVWMSDYFDTMIRNDNHYNNCLNYIIRNRDMFPGIPY